MNYKYVNNHEVYAWIGNALRVCTIEKQIIDGEEPALFVRCDFKKDELIEISWRMVFKSIEDYEANKPADLYGLSECQMKMESYSNGRASAAGLLPSLNGLRFFTTASLWLAKSSSNKTKSNDNRKVQTTSARQAKEVPH